MGTVSVLEVMEYGGRAHNVTHRREKSPIMGRPTDAPVSLTEMEVKWRFM